MGVDYAMGLVRASWAPSGGLFCDSLGGVSVKTVATTSVTVCGAAAARQTCRDFGDSFGEMSPPSTLSESLNKDGRVPIVQVIRDRACLPGS